MPLPRAYDSPWRPPAVDDDDEEEGDVAVGRSPVHPSMARGIHIKLDRPNASNGPSPRPYPVRNGRQAPASSRSEAEAKPKPKPTIPPFIVRPGQVKPSSLLQLGRPDALSSSRSNSLERSQDDHVQGTSSLSSDSASGKESSRGESQVPSQKQDDNSELSGQGQESELRQRKGAIEAKRTSSIASAQLWRDLELIDEQDDENSESSNSMKLKHHLLVKTIQKYWQLAMETWKEFKNPTTVLEPSNILLKKWMQIFTVSMFIACAIDPLYFFVVGVNKTFFCMHVNWRYVWTLTALRTLTDLCYAVHIALQFRLAYKEPTAPRQLLPWSSKNEPSPSAGQWIKTLKEIRTNYLRGWFIADVIGVLPLPQLLVFSLLLPGGVNATYVTSLLRSAVLLQYIPRISRCYPIVAGNQDTGMIFESAWASFILNLVMYVMASHVVGAIWYLTAVRRFYECAVNTCLDEAEALGCSPAFMHCSAGIHTRASDYAERVLWSSKTAIAENCVWSFKHEPEYYNYGVFNLAIPLMFQKRFFNKYFYSLQWGFTAISTLGGGSPPSEELGEVFFVFCVTGSGLFLFAVLIGNIQNFLQSLTRRTFEYQLHQRDMAIWMARRNLPHDLTQRVKELERLMWAANQGVDESEMLGSLTEDLQREVRRHLCLDLIRKSQLFSAMDEAVQDAIIERLRQRIYINGTVVIRKGSPVSRMFFVLKGELEDTSPGGGRAGIRHTVRLKNGDFFGEELLIAYLEKSDEKSKAKLRRRLYKTVEAAKKRTSEGQAAAVVEKADHSEVFPKSERTIVCKGPVEFFTLEAEDLEFVCKQFSSLLNSPRVQHALNQCSHHRRTHAATTIQLWYRTRMRTRLGISCAHAYLAFKQGRMGELIKHALLKKHEGKPFYYGVVVSRR